MRRHHGTAVAVGESGFGEVEAGGLDGTDGCPGGVVERVGTGVPVEGVGEGLGDGASVPDGVGDGATGSSVSVPSGGGDDGSGGE